LGLNIRIYSFENRGLPLLRYSLETIFCTFHFFF